MLACSPGIPASFPGILVQLAMTEIFKNGLNSKGERGLQTLKWLDCRAWVVWAK